MSREFTFNYPPRVGIAIGEYGTKAQSALSRQGYTIMGAVVAYLEAVEDGDADRIDKAVHNILLQGETAKRMNDRLLNVSDNFEEFGTGLDYDDGLSFQRWLEGDR